MHTSPQGCARDECVVRDGCYVCGDSVEIQIPRRFGPDGGRGCRSGQPVPLPPDQDRKRRRKYGDALRGKRRDQSGRSAVARACALAILDRAVRADSICLPHPFDGQRGPFARPVKRDSIVKRLENGETAAKNLSCGRHMGVEVGKRGVGWVGSGGGMGECWGLE